MLIAVNTDRDISDDSFGGLHDDEVSDPFVGIAMYFARLVDFVETGDGVVYRLANGDTILDVYGSAMVGLAEEIDEYVNKSGVESMGIEQDKDFLQQISDTREELTMIRRVLTQ